LQQKQSSNDFHSKKNKKDIQSLKSLMLILGMHTSSVKNL